MRRIWFAFLACTVLMTCAQTYPDLGGAQINKPFQRKVGGAVCFTGTGPIAGNAYFNFPTQEKKALSFIIGPKGPGQEKNEEFKGPGTYKNIVIFIKPVDDEGTTGRGDVVVNDDARTGTFTFSTSGQPQEESIVQSKDKPKSDAKAKPKDKDTDQASDDDSSADDNSAAAGTWDCGRKLPYQESSAANSFLPSRAKM